MELILDSIGPFQEYSSYGFPQPNPLILEQFPHRRPHMPHIAGTGTAFWGASRPGPNPILRLMNRGMTLIEALLGLALLAIAAAISVPEVAAHLDRLAVDRTIYHTAAAHRLARLKAVTANKVTVLSLDQDSVRIRVLSGRDTVQYWSHPGPTADGVTLSGPRRVLAFGPSGLARGAGNGTWLFRRRRASKRVVISRLGRLRILP